MSAPGERPPLELWVGIEATVNRVGEQFFDQMARNGHATRLSDLDLVADLAPAAVRYPFLWDHAEPEPPPAPRQWRWADERATRIRELGLRPIAGLLHHGSGPRGTSLVDPRFPARFAAYAAAFAERFPWIDDYTPVNEPLTTARFSGLYGVWYPHGRDDRTFCRALVNQLRATVLAMKAIREINPRARLVQTEDLGRTTGSPELAYQLEHNNTLRWLTFDLLGGSVGPKHPLYRYLTTLGGLTPADLSFFECNPCPPDVIGINHYVTSDRHLDVDLSRHPPATHGGNGRHRYADVETVLVAPHAGWQGLLMDVWERYRRPVAITEAHIDCAREEQLRWLWEAWSAAERARADGADVRAVTVWALFGSFDWNSLVTQDRGYYEAGSFDIRAPTPRPTAVARMARELATTGSFDHPVLAEPGWWRRRHLRPGDPPAPCLRGSSRPVLITGATGTLGRALARVCEQRGLTCRLVSRQDLEITSRDQIERVLGSAGAWAVINAAGYVRVDDAEDDPETCFAWNADGAALIAEACADRGLPYVTFSSDLVFDGENGEAYVETDAPAPLNVYGRSKAAAEARVLSAWPEALVVRTSSFFGPWDEHNFIAHVLRELGRGETVRVAGDVTVSPTYVPALAAACLDLLVDRETGICHLTNQGALTWAELGQRAARLAGLDAGRVIACSIEELGLRAARPRYSALCSRRLQVMPDVERSLHDFLHART